MDRAGFLAVIGTTLAVTLVFAAGCERATRATATGPQCFRVDPGQPHNPAGDVTHFRADYRDGHLVTDNVHVHDGGVTLTTRVELRRGVHGVEAESAGHPLEAALFGPAGSPSGWELVFREGDWQFRDRIEIAGDRLTITSTDQGETGPVVTRLRFHRAPCAEVEAAIAAAGPGR